jgi:hypothetical protein
MPSVTEHRLTTPSVVPLHRDRPADRWSLAARANEMRAAPRVPLQVDFHLIDRTGRTMLRCCSTNISRGGMYAAVPIGYGLAVGQCYEVRLRAQTDDIGPAPGAIVEGRAAVVWTELRLDGGDDRLGVGLQFDRPLPAGVIAHL